MSTPPYSSEFKDQVVREVQETQNATLVARRHPLSPGMVRRWVRAARQQDRENGGMSLVEENAQLKRLIIERDLQIAVLQDALRKKGSHPLPHDVNGPTRG